MNTDDTTILDGQATGVTSDSPESEFLNEASIFDQMADIAEQTKPEVPDQNEPRYGVSMLFDIDISKRNCYNKFGEYGSQLTALPRLVLIPFYTIGLDIPAEQPGGVIHGESYGDLIEQFSGAFDFEAYSATLATNVMRRQNRSAKVCSDIFLRDHNNDDGVFGVDVFPSLQNLDYKDGANRIFSTVLPVFNGGIFPERRRLVLGYPVDGPFLDAIASWLKGGSLRAIDASKLPDDFKERAEKVRFQLVALVSETISRSKSRIARKNDLIKKGDAPGYDQPNYRQPDAPKPPDLLMLANTNTPPLQEEEMARAEMYAQGARDKQGTSPDLDIAAIVSAAIKAATPEIVRQTREAVLAEVGLSGADEAKVPIPKDHPDPKLGLDAALAQSAGAVGNGVKQAEHTENAE